VDAKFNIHGSLEREQCGGAILGKVRPEKVKRIAHELVRRYPDKFTSNFEENKKIIVSYVNTPSVKLRNRIAGYVTRLVSLSEQENQ